MILSSVFAIATGLAMDSFAVSVSAGTTVSKHKLKTALILGGVFGFFQGFMPVLGWLAGFNFAHIISQYAHWIAFLLLAIIGLRMIQEGLSDKDCEERIIDINNPSVLLILGIATSIDALVVGLSFAFLDESIVVPAIIIGLVTFVISFAGVYLGDKLGSAVGRHAEILGGIILILIGVKIVFEKFL